MRIFGCIIQIILAQLVCENYDDSEIGKLEKLPQKYKNRKLLFRNSNLRCPDFRNIPPENIYIVQSNGLLNCNCIRKRKAQNIIPCNSHVNKTKENVDIADIPTSNTNIALILGWVLFGIAVIAGVIIVIDKYFFAVPQRIVSCARVLYNLTRRYIIRRRLQMPRLPSISEGALSSNSSQNSQEHEALPPPDLNGSNPDADSTLDEQTPSPNLSGSDLSGSGLNDSEHREEMHPRQPWTLTFTPLKATSSTSSAESLDKSLDESYIGHYPDKCS